MSNPQITNLMNKEMSRKEFLSVVALVVGSILGFSHVINFLTGKSLESHSVLSNDAVSKVYGK